MKDRISQLLESEGLSASKFSEIMGVQPSGVSHILSGRNKPGFDFITKLLTKFANISPDWLLMGEGPMYRSEDAQKAINADKTTQTSLLFDAQQNEDENLIYDYAEKKFVDNDFLSSFTTGDPVDAPNNGVVSRDAGQVANIATENNVTPNEPPRIERVMVFYANGTVDTYIPNKKQFEY